MNSTGYAIAGYGLIIGMLALYIFSLIVRSKRK